MWNRQPPEERLRQQFYEQLKRADGLADANQYSKALPAYEDCLKLAGKGKMMLPIDHVLTIWKNLSTCHFQLDNYDKTLHYCRGVIAITTEWIEANQPGKDVSAELSKNKSAPVWAGLLPDGVHFAITKSFDPWPHLADLAAVAGSASNYAERPDDALNYYKQAIAAYTHLKQPNEVVTLWIYVANIHKRREDWDKVIKVAAKILQLSQEFRLVQAQLQAHRLLGQAHIARGEYIEALEAQTHLILLGRQANDPRLKIDNDSLEWLFDTMRKQADFAQDGSILEAVIQAQRLLSHPDIKQDQQRLAQLSKQADQPYASPMDGKLRSLRDVSDVMKQFAETYCGPQSKSPENWSLGMEEMEEYEKINGELVENKLPGVMLYLSREPETVIRVTLRAENCKVSLMYEYKLEYIPGIFRMALKGEKPLLPPAQANALMQSLESFIQEGRLVRQQNRLVYAGTK